MTLVLRAVDVTGPERWRWELVDGTDVVAQHEVVLDPVALEHIAFTDLYGYLRNNVPPDQRIAAEATLVDRVGLWAGEHILGSGIGRELVRRQPVTVQVAIPQGAEFLLDQPLELSYVDGQPLARRDIALVYTWAGDPKRDKEPVSEKLRILALFSMPVRGSVLALRRERYELARRIAELTNRAVELRVVQYGVTRERLAETVEEYPGWDVLHVAAHGTHGALILEKADGSPDEVSTVDLVKLLGPTRHRLKLAVLGACHSGAATAARILRRIHLDEQADQVEAAERRDTDTEGSTVGLARGLVEQLGVAVLAMRYPVEDRFAIALTNELYPRLLQQGQPVDRATARAVAAAAEDAPSPHRPALSLGTPALFGAAAAHLRLTPPTHEANFNPYAQAMAGFPAEPARFVGRTKAMVEASAALAPRSGRSGVLFVGMAGAGKTTCALELAYQHRDSFGALVWWRAPTQDASPNEAVVSLAETLETQLGHRGFVMRDAIATDETLRRFLPHLTALLREQSVLLVLDNLETLLSSTGQWQDPMWAALVEALTEHDGLSQVLLTSRVRPAGLDPVRVLELPVHALSLAEAVVLAGELPHLGQLLHADPTMPPGTGRLDPDPELGQRVLAVVQGHPKLLELADAAARDPGQLRQRLATASQAVASAQGRLAAFFGTGESALDGADFLDALTAWTTTAVRDLRPDARTLVELLACVEDDDRRSFVVANVWPYVWQARHGGAAPAWEQALADLQAAALVEAEPTGPGVGAVAWFGLHPGVAEAVRATTDPAWHHTVDEVLADLWSAVYKQAGEAEEHGAQGASQTVVYAGLAAAPYLLRLGHWADASIVLEHAARRDASPQVTRRVLGHLRRVLHGETDPDRRLEAEGVYAQVLGRVDPAAARTRLAALRDTARDTGRFRTASAVAGELLTLLRRYGQLTEALAAADDKTTLTEAAGLGPWTQALDQVRRLQILAAMGHHRQVAEQATALLAHLDTLSATPGRNDPVQPWNVRETALDTAHTAALALDDWSHALQLNQRIADSRHQRGATTHDITNTRFNDYGPLLSLGRLDDADHLLRHCQQVYTDTTDIPALGLVFSARADLQALRGHPTEAIALEHTALRYHYQQPQPDRLAASHNNLASHLTQAAHHPHTVLAHRLAAALLRRATGRTAALTDTLHNLATDLRDHPDTTPPDLTALTTTVEQVPGVRFAAVLAALVPDAGTQAALLAEIVEAARSIDLVARQLEQWEPMIDAMVAAAGGDQSATSALTAAFDKAPAEQATVIAVLRRIIAGERGDTLLDGLDEIDTAIVRRVLERLAEP